MALTQPILNTVAPFDATQAQVFTFLSSGSSAPITGNTLTIRNNVTNAIVYSQTQTTYAYSHTLPANTLSNGGNYVATITTRDASGDVSPTSNGVQFYCFATPSFGITNMPTSGVIQNSSFEFSATYNQANGELLNGYVFNLYNQAGAIIATSSTQYTTANELPIAVSWLFTGFSDNTQYSVEVIGQTVHGMSVTTGRVPFTVSYSESQVFSALVLTNNCRGGYITIQSNINAIDGTAYPEPPVYIDNDSIDLRANGSYAEFTSGFRLNGDFTARVWGTQFTPNSTVLSFSATDGSIITLVYKQSDTTAWLELRVLTSGWQFGYTAQSNSIDIPATNEQVYMMLRRVDSVYQLDIMNKGVGA